MNPNPFASEAIDRPQSVPEHQPSLCGSAAFLFHQVFLVPVSPFEADHAVAAALLEQQVLLQYTCEVGVALLAQQVLLRYTAGVALAVA